MGASGPAQRPAEGECVMKWVIGLAAALGMAAIGGASSAQEAGPPAAAPAAAAPAHATPRPPRRGPPQSPPLGDGPWDIMTAKGPVHVTVVTKGLDHPWALAFLPDHHTMLVTEREGRLRVIRDGVLDPDPVAGLPDLLPGGLGGLMDIALHPNFARNHLVYLTYTKPGPQVRSNSTVAVWRARWDGKQLVDGKDIWVADAWYGQPPLPKRCCGQGPATGSFGSRLAFDAKGYLYVTSGDRNYGEKVQDLDNDFGKIVRLKDDGSIPHDNPFYGRRDVDGAIWTLGHRNPEGLFYDKTTGILWESEFGPRGGDEINVIKKGHNYGWIDVTQGKHYNNEPAKGVKNVKGMTDPVIAFIPDSINPGNLVVYHGSKFPAWKGDIIMGTMTRSVWRAVPHGMTAPTDQERMLTDLHQRIRDTRVGPDGDIYLLTDETGGALLRIEPGK
jgi:glucose/arabinose dehydrogenase